MDKQFYLRDTRSDVGSTCIFWNKNGAGYGSDLDNAELFCIEVAQKYASERGHFIPLEKTAVDKVVTRRVDMQILHNIPESENPAEDTFIIQCNVSRFDGNDIYFKCEGGGETADYMKAKLFTLNEALLSLQGNAGRIFSVTKAQKFARPTLQAENVSTRKMITGPGIKWKKPRKKKESSGKVRHNCSGITGNYNQCGKIVWEFDPYSAAYCSHWCEMTAR